MNAISAEASRTDVGAARSVLATMLPGPVAHSLSTNLGATICDQLVCQVSIRRQVGDAPLRILDRGETLLDLSIRDFGRMGHGFSLP